MTVAPVFRIVGEGRYQLAHEPTGVVIELDRLRRERHELVGELTVVCPLAGAHAVTPDGLIHLADFNVSSAQVRNTRAKVLRERSEAELDWATWLEALCLQTIRSERGGVPSRPISTYGRRVESPMFSVHGWQLPRSHPAILFGDGGSMKSYLALYAAGGIARQGIPTMYCDWELDGEDHHERLLALFGESVPEVHYLRCDRPLIDEADRIRREVGRLGIGYLVCDSVGFATPGPPESAEMAVGYFRAVRQIGVGGSLHLAHSTKSTTDDGSNDHKPRLRGLKPFGSVFWHNSARSTWYARRADEGTDDRVITVGLFHQKANTGALLRPVGLSVSFAVPGKTQVAPTDLAATSDLSSGLSLRQRLTHALQSGPRTIAELADDLDAKKDTIEKTLRRSKNPDFLHVVNTADGIHRWGIAHDGPEM